MSRKRINSHAGSWRRLLWLAMLVSGSTVTIGMLSAAVPQANIAAAQSAVDSGVSAIPSQNTATAEPTFRNLISTRHAIEACILMLGIAVGVSIAVTGQQGWGWRIMTLLLAVAAIIGKAILGLFLEVTQESCPPDWDE